ncbi:hypothetical protein [Dactylosporangium darangshiense]|uniref:hypothetical protein n=1 Tax=Dactylosporangium darangshiense TaxID=579108 RepID=UPI0036424C56
MSAVTPTQLESDAPRAVEPEPSLRDRVSPRLRRRLPDLIAAAAYLMIAAIVLGHYWPDVRHRISGHLPDDHLWFEWLLGHGAYTVRHLSNPLVSMRQNVPVGVNMMANTSVLGLTIPLAPLTMLLGPQIVYLLWLGGAPAATAFSSYWVLSRHLVKSRPAAAVAGAFVGFAPGIVHHANGQANFLTNFLLPFIVLRAMKLAEDGRWLRNGIYLGLLVTYQAFLNEEQLLVTALGCVVALLAYAAMRQEEAKAMLKPFFAAAGVAALIAVTLLAYPLWYQFKGPQTFQGLPFSGWGEDVRAFFTYPRDSLAGDASTERTIGITEQNSWYGITLFALVPILVIVLWRSLHARIAAITGAVFAVCSLGANIRWNGHLTSHKAPWSLIPADAPLVGLLLPTRLVYVSTLAIGVLLALAWDKVARPDGSARDWFRFDARIAIAIALIPLIPTPVPVQSADPIPHFITSEKWRPYTSAGGTLVPVPVPNNRQGIAGLQWSGATLHEFAIPAGYFLGPDENGKGRLGVPARPTTTLLDTVAATGQVPQITDKNKADALRDLRYWHAAILVLPKTPNHDALFDTLEALFGPGQRVDDVWLWDVRALTK